MTDISADISQAHLQKGPLLTAMGVPPDMIDIPVIGSLYFASQGGTPISQYWQNSSSPTMRDEFFLSATTYFATAGFISSLTPKNDWELAFHVAFLFHLKANMQSVASIDALCRLHCYGDAFSVTRSMHSRINLLVLSCLNPYLFNEWLKNPRDPKFFDGKVRQILQNNGIDTMNHMYEHYSEIIHGQFQALSEVGYMVQGVFPDVPAIMNQVYVSAKYLLAIAGYSLVAMTIADIGESQLPDNVKESDKLYEIFEQKLLAHNRLEHLQTIIAEERHWKKIRKGEQVIGSTFSHAELRDQISKFHRDKQRKRLPKPYDAKKRTTE